MADLPQLLTLVQVPQVTDHFPGVKAICPAHGKRTDLESVTRLSRVSTAWAEKVKSIYIYIYIYCPVCYVLLFNIHSLAVRSAGLVAMCDLSQF